MLAWNGTTYGKCDLILKKCSVLHAVKNNKRSIYTMDNGKNKLKGHRL